MFIQIYSNSGLIIQFTLSIAGRDHATGSAKRTIWSEFQPERTTRRHDEILLAAFRRPDRGPDPRSGWRICPDALGDGAVKPPTSAAAAYQSKPASDTMVRLHRVCLSCAAVFDSAWSGERICLRCKKTNAWRNGTAVATRKFGQSPSRSGRKGS